MRESREISYRKFHTFGIVVILTGDPYLLLIEMSVAASSCPRKESMSEDLAFTVEWKIVSMVSSEMKKETFWYN